MSMQTHSITEDKKIPVDWENVARLAENALLPDDDTMVLTDEILARARPARDILHEIVPVHIANILLSKQSRPKSKTPKEQVTLRLSPDVLAYFRSKGRGWQTHIDQALKKMVSAHI